jgi:hypothetical protein
MRILVSVKPNSKQESVIQNSEGTFVVRVNAPPAEGRANRRLIELLAQYFGTSKSKIELVSGSKSKLKTFKVKC